MYGFELMPLKLRVKKEGGSGGATGRKGVGELVVIQFDMQFIT